METGINLLGEWKANEREIIKNLSILRSEANVESVHDTRVAIKKLRAYSELLNELDKTLKIDLPQTKSLFDILGKHREWDTILKHLQKSPDDLSELCPLFVSHIRQAKDQLLYLIKNALEVYTINEVEEVSKKVEEIVRVMTLHKVADDCKKIILQHMIKLKKQSIHFKKEPHDTRKSLKIIFYWINLFPPETLYSNKQVKELDLFLDKLGKWHDLAILFKKIKNYRQDYLAKSLDEYKLLKKLEDDIRSKRDRIFSSLNPAVIINEIKNYSA